jgi:hypothetical protein
MIIQNFYVSRFTLQPFEADSVLVVDTNAVLTFSVSVKRFQSVTGRREQIAQIIAIVQIDQFAPSGLLDDQRQFSRDDSLEKSFRFGVREGFNHALMVSPNDNIIKSSGYSGAA